MNEQLKEDRHDDDSSKGCFVDILEDIGYIVIRAIQGMGQSNVTIMASGLVYSTLIAIVPCITFFIAFLTVFGMLQPFMDVLSEFFQDIFGPALGGQMMSMVDQFSSNAMGLGVFGLVSFIITATFLVDKVYTVLNQVFRTQPSTGTFKRLTTFLTFLIVGVVLLAVVMSLNNTLINFMVSHMNEDAGGTSVLSSIISSCLTFLLAVALLFMLYYFVPNAKIRARSAALGALLAAIALTVLFTVFKMVVARMVSYSVIYGSLASLFFILLFLYACWYIILTCAEVIYVHQFRPQRDQLAGGPETPSRQIADAVNTMMLIGLDYKEGKGAISRKDLTRRLAITPVNLTSYLSLLEGAGLVIEISEGKAARYVPSRPLDQIFLYEIFDAIYGYDDSIEVNTVGEAVTEQAKSSCDSSFGQLTLENLLERI